MAFSSWYENFVTSTLEPSWFHDFALLEHELREQFGSINAEVIVERKINQLKMRSEDSISNYITHFTSLKNDVEWNDAALSFAFKRGLPARIKDEIARNNFRPTTFQESNRGHGEGAGSGKGSVCGEWGA